MIASKKLVEEFRNSVMGVMKYLSTSKLLEKHVNKEIQDKLKDDEIKLREFTDKLEVYMEYLADALKLEEKLELEEKNFKKNLGDFYQNSSALCPYDEIKEEVNDKQKNFAYRTKEQLATNYLRGEIFNSLEDIHKIIEELEEIHTDKDYYKGSLFEVMHDKDLVNMMTLSKKINEFKKIKELDISRLKNELREGISQVSLELHNRNKKINELKKDMQEKFISLPIQLLRVPQENKVKKLKEKLTILGNNFLYGMGKLSFFDSSQLMNLKDYLLLMLNSNLSAEKLADIVSFSRLFLDFYKNVSEELEFRSHNFVSVHILFLVRLKKLNIIEETILEKDLTQKNETFIFILKLITSFRDNFKKNEKSLKYICKAVATVSKNIIDFINNPEVEGPSFEGLQKFKLATEEILSNLSCVKRKGYELDTLYYEIQDNFFYQIIKEQLSRLLRVSTGTSYSEFAKLLDSKENLRDIKTVLRELLEPISFIKFYKQKLIPFPKEFCKDLLSRMANFSRKFTCLEEGVTITFNQLRDDLMGEIVGIEKSFEKLLLELESNKIEKSSENILRDNNKREYKK